MNFFRKLKGALLSRYLGTITHVNTNEPLVALTFDDGPDSRTTPQLLNILQRHQARATFFMIGENALRFPELVQQIAEEGHTVANHSWGHASFPYISGSARRAEIRKGGEALSPYGEKLFRPPYGNQTFWSRIDALRTGYQVVTWSLAAHDWLDHDAQQMVDDVSAKIKPGSIILFHDGMYDTIKEHYRDREPMLAAVDSLLSCWSGQYQFVTVPELLGKGIVQKQYWLMKAEKKFLNELQCTSGAGHRYQV